jgi:uncharacterized protein with FMN-binding domain
MKRAILAITGTIAGLAALLGFKSHTTQLTAAPPPPAGSNPSASQNIHSTGGGAPPGSTTTPSRHAHASRHARTSSTPKQYVGSAVNNGYSIIQVAVNVAGGHITAVTLPRLQPFDAASRTFNSQALPILVRETMHAQSARINTLSGATYTSLGYQQSLQSALNKAGM